MIPYSVLGKTKFRAYGTFGLLTLMVLFFLWEVYLSSTSGKPISAYFEQYALMTCQVGQQSFLETMIDTFRSLFMHETFTQFMMNMIFLWVFAPRVEEYFGHRRFLLFFGLVGFGGYVASILFAPACVALVGPAGAIMGILAAFVVLFPGKRIETMIVALVRKFDLPALFFFGLYFALSVFVLESGPLSGQIRPFWDELGGAISGFIIIFVALMFKPTLNIWREE